MTLFNYYWQDRAFYYASIAEIEEHLRELDKIMTNDSQLAEFYKKVGFEDAPHCGKSSVSLLMTKFKDRQLYLKILPFIMQRFKTIDRAFFLPADMESEYPKMYNAFLGPRFVNIRDAKCFIKNESEFLDYRDSVIYNTISGNTLPVYCGLKLKHVVITAEGFAMAKPLGDELERLFKDMVALDNYIAEGNWRGRFSEHDFHQKYSVRISDESDTVKRHPKKNCFRYFWIPKNGGQYCFLHIKEGDLRIHIYPDEGQKIVYVPYIGPHLPL